MRATIQPRGTRSPPPISRPRFHPRYTRKGTQLNLHLVAVAAAGLVGLLGPDEDGRRGGGGGLAVYQALGARGVLAAAGADGAQLHHLVGLGEENRHRTEGTAAEVH